MATIPDLSGVATEGLVDTIGGGNFSASYINWAKTLQLLREHATGWHPTCIHQEHGECLFQAPVGGYVQVYFMNEEGDCSPAVVQAVMNNRHQAIPYDDITSVDISNAIVRGYCKAAAVTFGLAYRLWVADEKETGFAESKTGSLPSKWQESESSKAKKSVESRPQDLPHEEERLPWHTTIIHFGKNKGKLLGKLPINSLQWYQNSWEVNPDFAKEVDYEFRRMLDQSMGKSTEDEEEERQQATQDDDSLPF